jgi:hypothetical protein
MADVNHAHMARVHLAQAAHVRRKTPQFGGWHATLLQWAANSRLRHAEALRAAAQVKPPPVQGDLFEGLF